MRPSLCLQDLARLFAVEPRRRSAPLDQATLSWVFESVSTDSRALQPGDLFIPLKGERFDGHDFLDAAVSVGVAAAIVSRYWSGYIPEQLAVLPVDDTLCAYQRIALAWRRRLQQPVIAVTGSAGKTTTRELIKACLAPLGRVEASVGNENNDIGVPRTVLRSQAGDGALVLEMGMRGLGEIERLSVCAEPDVAVITNIGTAHIGRLGSREAIATAKCEITAALRRDGLVVIPAGDRRLEWALAQIWQGRVCRVAIAGDELAQGTPSPDLLGHLNGISLQVEQGGSTLCALQLPLEGRHNARNLLLALAVALEHGICAAGLATLQVTLPGGRSRRHQLTGDFEGVTVLDETYNASPEAMLASLDVLQQQSGRHFAVLGTMLELGEQSEFLHFEVGRRAAQLGLDGMVVLADGAAASAMLQGAAGLEQLAQVHSPEEAAELLRQWLQPGDHLLLKASRGVALERLITILAPATHTNV
jgi:UDP-N-acetylmuramoyl-tripeptide--D-alanyl-D-alanine ligase